MYTVLILLFFVILQLFTQRECVKVTFFEIPDAPRKSQCYSIFPGAPCIYQFSNVLCSDTRVFILICHGLTKEYVKSNLFFVISGALRKKKRYCFFRGAPCIQQFQNV